jgi:dTDP-4-dehydrorhamnose reductase
MHILVTGGDGQLARAIVRRGGGHAIAAYGRSQLDVTSADAADLIRAARPDVVINAAAMTDVDGCESDPEGAFRINAIGAWNVARAADDAGASVVQVSTDYVFSGGLGRAYVETDAPDPVSVYGVSKLAAEHLVRAVNPRAYVVRSAWLFGLEGRSFVTRILELAALRPSLDVVDTEVGSPTFCDDLADALLRLAATGQYGTYHLANGGECSRLEFARAILDGAGQRHFPLRAAESFERPARPPAYAPLGSAAAARVGIRLPPWRDGLARFLAQRQESFA